MVIREFDDVRGGLVVCEILLVCIAFCYRHSDGPCLFDDS
jgi:hypothetical protein